ncbi:MAG: hypothetical protein AB7P02_15725 [Alphaproteobacteria bacterium]
MTARQSAVVIPAERLAIQRFRNALSKHWAAQDRVVADLPLPSDETMAAMTQRNTDAVAGMFDLLGQPLADELRPPPHTMAEVGLMLLVFDTMPQRWCLGTLTRLSCLEKVHPDTVDALERILRRAWR